MSGSRVALVVRLSVLGMVGGVIGAVGATVTHFASPSVSDTMTSYPYTSNVFVFTELLWTVSHVLAVAGIIGFARSGLAGPSRLAHVGITLATVGLALMIPLEFGYVFAADSEVDDLSPMTLSTLFGIAIMLTALGMILAGIATIRSGGWSSWRRFVPVTCGVYGVAMIPLVFTSIALLAIAVFYLAFLALSYAVYTRPEPEPSTVGTPSTAAFEQV